MASLKSDSTYPICIGYDAKRYFNNTTGLGNYSRWIINGLTNNKDLKLKLFTPKKTTETDTHFIITPRGFWKYLRSLWRVIGINKAIINNKIQVFHGLSNELPFGIHRSRVKTVVTIHDCINLRYPKNYKLIDRIIYKYKLAYAQKVADAIVVPSVQTKNDLIHFFKTKESKIKIIPLSVREIPHFQKAPRKPYILCISSFDKRKNLQNLIDAYNRIESTPYNLIIAGKLGSEFKHLSETCSKNTSIILIPNPTTEQIHSLYSDAIYCVYPSIFEGFGIPILEAFSHGKTIATSNISSMPEVGGDGAEYFNPLEIKDIKRSLITLLDAGYRTELEKKASEQLKKFNSELLLLQYQELYTGLLSFTSE